MGSDVFSGRESYANLVKRLVIPRFNLEGGNGRHIRVSMVHD